MKLLLVEDSVTMRGVIHSMLTKLGFKDVVEAEHGGQAWDILRSGKVDLLLTGWDMPVVDGLELVQKIRNDDKTEHIPVLMFSARSGKEDVLTAMRAGIDTYISKPFNLAQLKAKLQSISGHRSKRQIFQVTNGATKNLRDGDNPLIILAETRTDPGYLALPNNSDIRGFLYRSITGLNLLNSRRDGPAVGYILPKNTNEVTSYMRASQGRIKLLMVSPDLNGGGVTLARLLSINSKGRVKIFLLCETANDLPVQVRYGLTRLDVTILERHKLGIEDLESLFGEYITLETEDDAADQLLSPEEIGKRLENDIRHMVNLPVLPQVYHKIVALDRDKNSEINDWVEAIETDPLTQAQVIRRARSPIYGFRGEIKDTSKAVVLMGKNTIKELVVSSAVRRSCENLADASFKVEEYWIHSVAVGTMARLLSFPMDEALWTPDHRKSYEEFELDEETKERMKAGQLYKHFPLEPYQDPFIGGMMHDIGKIAMVHAYPGIFASIMSIMDAQNWNRPMSAAEEVVTGGFNHCQVGRLLGESWKLGDVVCDLIEYHHNPSKDDAFSRLIALADFLVSGLYRYPSQARYPMTYILEEEDPEAEAGEEDAEAPIPPDAKDEKPDGEEAAEAIPADAEEAENWAKIAAESPNDALVQFMPEDLAQSMGLAPSDLIDLGRALTPVIRRLTERLQQSS